MSSDFVYEPQILSNGVQYLARSLRTSWGLWQSDFKSLSFTTNQRVIQIWEDRSKHGCVVRKLLSLIRGGQKMKNAMGKSWEEGRCPYIAWNDIAKATRRTVKGRPRRHWRVGFEASTGVNVTCSVRTRRICNWERRRRRLGNKSQAFNCQFRRSEVHIQSRVVHLGFVVDRMSLRWVILKILRFSPATYNLTNVPHWSVTAPGYQIIQPISTILRYQFLCEALLYTPHITELLVQKLMFLSFRVCAFVTDTS
jgi:hypothetical protein